MLNPLEMREYNSVMVNKVANGWTVVLPPPTMEDPAFEIAAIQGRGMAEGFKTDNELDKLVEKSKEEIEDKPFKFPIHDQVYVFKKYAALLAFLATLEPATTN